MIFFNDKITNFCSLLVISGLLALSACSGVTDSDDDGEEEEITEYNLTVSANPSEGGSVDPEGGTYEEGTEVTVEASANEDWVFAGWTGDEESGDNPLTFEITSDTELTANFEEETDETDEVTEYDLSVSASPSEGGSVDPESGTYEEGEEVEVTATASDGWTFTGWTGDEESEDNPLTVEIKGDTELTANFEEEYDLSVSASPSEGGSVDPRSGTYDEGEEVKVTAIPADGWRFAGWTGDIRSQDNPLTFEITSDTDLTANFEAKNYSNEIEVTDGQNNQTLTFGMDEDATDGYDAGLDEQAPPPPPEGGFDARFIIDNDDLYRDYRPTVNERVEWELNFSAEGENSITLNWDFNPSDYAGSLTLVDDPDNPSTEVNMDSETSHEVSDSSINTLYIIQE